MVLVPALPGDFLRNQPSLSSCAYKFRRTEPEIGAVDLLPLAQHCRYWSIDTNLNELRTMLRDSSVKRNTKFT